MRKELKTFLDQKVQLTGTLDRYGMKSEYIGGNTVTILMKDITLTNQNGHTIRLDHAWLKAGKTLAKLNAPAGSMLNMNAHVKEYVKGYVGRDREIGVYTDNRTVDYGIQRASAIKVKSSGKGQTFSQYLRAQMNSGHFMSNKYDIQKSS